MKYNNSSRVYKGYIGACLVIYRIVMLFYSNSRAQEKRQGLHSLITYQGPRDIKVLEEHKDKNGNIVRTIQYRQGKTADD